MKVNKKFDRLKQWSKERMGGEAKTETSDDFKALEAEMQYRHEGTNSPFVHCHRRVDLDPITCERHKQCFSSHQSLAC